MTVSLVHFKCKETWLNQKDSLATRDSLFPDFCETLVGVKRICTNKGYSGIDDAIKKTDGFFRCRCKEWSNVMPSNV